MTVISSICLEELTMVVHFEACIEWMRVSGIPAVSDNT